MNDIELRTQPDGSPGLRVLAARTEHSYQVRAFNEIISRHAFASSLSRGDLDVVLRVEHDSRDVLARTPLTLRLEETREGLVGHATGDAEDPLWRQTIRRIERGVLKEASFAFKVPEKGDVWSSDSTERRINTINLHRGDISLTVYGANPDTGATVIRSATERRAIAAAVRSTGWCGTYLGRGLRQEPVLTPIPDPADLDEGEMVDCPRCGGSGRKDGLRCSLCDGTGEVTAEVAEDFLGDGDGDADEVDTYSTPSPVRSVRRDLLPPNDTADLLRELHRVTGDGFAIEREWQSWEAEIVQAVHAERAARDARWDTHPDRVLRDALFASYERLT